MKATLLKATFIGAGLLLASVNVNRAAIVYSDDFNRSTLNGGSYTYTSVTTAGDGAATINGSTTLQLSNDGSAAANANGYVYSSTPVSAFGSPYSAQLNATPGTVTWTFNMQQIRTDPAGFASGNYGAAFVLGATATTFSSAGNGYAVLFGQSGTTDPVRLVSFTGGLSGTLNNIISATSPLSDVGNSYLSLRVAYNPVGNTWTLDGRNDGASSFADPTSGSLSSLGSANNSLYTGSTLGYMGALWSYSTAANQTALFDNFSINITPVPEPVNVAMAVFGVVAVGTGGIRRYFKNRKDASL